MNKPNKILILFLCIILIFSISACNSTPYTSEDDPVAYISNRTVQGFYEDNVAKFYGIPFAKAPVGELRFAPPQDLQEEINDVLICDEMKPSALQIPDESKNQKYSEDCLYLDVWAPQDYVEHNNDIPVLVFIHGGGFVSGSPNNDTYDGTRFAQDGIIQVNIAYRLNALGFAGFKEIESHEGYFGNMGLLDQIQGLRWVQDNIQSFGGDPENITVCGESAGSMSISNLITSDNADGLFQKAIMESGNTLGQQILAPKSSGEREDTLKMSLDLMDAVGAKDMDDMLEVDGNDVVENSTFSFDMTKQTAQYFFPTYDGELLPKNPYKAATEGKLNDVDILVGHNTDEGSIFIPQGITGEEYDTYIDTAFDDNAQAVKEKYPIDGDNSAADRLRHLVKLGLTAGNPVFADSLVQNDNDVYMYEFAYSTEALDKAGMGAHHALELYFVFDTLPEDYQDEESLKIRDNVHSMWLNFIVNGTPNIGENISLEWPKYESSDKKILKIDTIPQVEEYPLTDDVEFLKKLLWES